MTSQLRVLHLIDSLGGGGAERSLQELLPGLQTQGISSQIACGLAPENGVEAELLGHFPITWLPGSRSAQVRKVHALIKDERIQIVHTSLFNSDLIGRLSSLHLPTKVLTNLVNTPYVDARLSDPGVRRWRLEAVRQVDGFTARHLTDHFLAISRTVKDHSVSALRIRAEDVTVIPRGRDPRRLGAPSRERRERTRRALGLDHGQPLILNVGRQEHQKGQEFLIRAHARLLERQPDAVVVIAGRRGHSTPALHKLANELGVESSLIWLGHRNDVPDLMAGADVFAFPSLYEGLGGSLLEAMSLGLPIVASDIPAIAETAPANVAAILVPASDSDALAQALGRVIADHRLSRKLGAGGQRRFLDRYTLDAMVTRTSSLYRGLVGW